MMIMIMMMKMMMVIDGDFEFLRSWCLSKPVPLTKSHDGMEPAAIFSALPIVSFFLLLLKILL